MPGDSVNAAVQWRIMGLTYTYAFIQNDRFELACGSGCASHGPGCAWQCPGAICQL